MKTTKKKDTQIISNWKQQYQLNRTTNSIWLEKNVSRIREVNDYDIWRIYFFWCDACNPLVVNDIWPVSHHFSVTFSTAYNRIVRFMSRFRKIKGLKYVLSFFSLVPKISSCWIAECLTWKEYIGVYVFAENEWIWVALNWVNAWIWFYISSFRVRSLPNY